MARDSTVYNTEGGERIELAFSPSGETYLNVRENGGRQAGVLLTRHDLIGLKFMLDGLEDDGAQ